MTRKAEISNSAVQSTKVLQEPIQTTEKWKRIFFQRFTRRDWCYTALCTTRLYAVPSAMAVPLQNTSCRRWLVYQFTWDQKFSLYAG